MKDTTHPNAPGNPGATSSGLQLDAIAFSFDAPALKVFQTCRRPGDRLAPSVRRTPAYKFVQSIVDEHGNRLGVFMHDGPGSRRGLIEVLGPESAWYWEQARANFSKNGLRVSRRDECLDFHGSDMFSKLRVEVEALKKKHGLFRENRGDEDHPDLGQTVYVGQLGKSKVLLRLYERHKHPKHAAALRGKPVARLELQVKPVGAVAQTRASSWKCGDMWGTRDWTREILEILTGLGVERIVMQPSGRATDDDQMLWNLVKRSGKRLDRIARKLGGWNYFGSALGDLYQEYLDSQREPTDL